MESDRRTFLKTASTLGAGFMLAGSNMPVGILAPRRSLKILILGGTSFLGPHQIAYALERGHSITTFTRGRTAPSVHADLFGHVESLIGDREDNLTALEGRQWDAVIDNSGRQEKWTRDSAQLLKDSAGLYLYTSSTGVYYPYLESRISEDKEPNLIVPNGISEVQQMEYGYGVMKAKSERETIEAFGAQRSIIVRPTYMMGPADRTDRFTYWPVRLQKGGDVMVPGFADDPVQYMDVRDIAEWMIRLIESGTTGLFNGVGPASPTGMLQFVHGAHAAFNSQASFTSIPDYDFLALHGVHDAVPWIMPTGENFGSARVVGERGVEAGLTYRPLSDSVRDIYDWWMSDAVEQARREKMLNDDRSLMTREAGILADWRARS